MRLVNQCSDLRGELSAGNAALLRQLLQAPDEQLWARAQRMVICDRPLMTLRTAVTCISKNQVQELHSPDFFTLYRALRYAVDKRSQFHYHPDVCDSES